MIKSFLNSFPPLFVLALMGFSYYTYVIEFCFIFLTNPVKKIVYLTFYHIIILMFTWSFLSTMFKFHKPVPDEYHLTPDEHSRLVTFSESEADNILKKIIGLRKLEVFTCSPNGRIRYCNFCMTIKPDRTHHCSTCKRCIMKMDHHCPWVGNCIGFVNYKQFILLLMYGTLWCFFYVGTVAEFIIELWKDVQNSLNRLYIAIGFMVAAFSSTLVTILFFYHLCLLCRNETTIEALRETHFRTSNTTFDMGRWYNITEVCGDNICCWLIPIQSGRTNGYEFQLGSIIT